MQRLERVWNSPACLCQDHIFERTARGDHFLAVIIRWPTRADSVMTEVRDIGYLCITDAHSLRQIDRVPSRSCFMRERTLAMKQLLDSALVNLTQIVRVPSLA